jgi:hypothetical protein
MIIAVIYSHHRTELLLCAMYAWHRHCDMFIPSNRCFVVARHHLHAPHQRIHTHIHCPRDPLAGGIPRPRHPQPKGSGKHHHGRSPAYSTAHSRTLSTHCHRSEAFPRSSFSTRRATPSPPTGGLLWLSQTSSPGWTGPTTARRMGVLSCDCYQGWLDAAVIALLGRSYYAAATCTSVCLPPTHEI